MPIAEKAVRLSGGAEPHILDTYAVACYLTGDTARAIELEQRAVALTGSSSRGRDVYNECLDAMRRGAPTPP